MASAGTVSFITKGEYSASTTYKRLNTVRYNNQVYVALKTVTGITPSDDGENWQLFVDTPEVIPEEIKPTFEIPSNRENIVSGESLPTLFGKIKKWLVDLKPHAFTNLTTDIANPISGSALGAEVGTKLKGDIDTQKAEFDKEIADINSNLSNTLCADIGWYPNGKALNEVKSGAYGVKPDSLPPGIPDNIFNLYGVILVISGTYYPTAIYMSVTGQMAFWASNSKSWAIVTK